MTRAPARIRPARPDDYDAIISVVDGWWGRPVVSILNRLHLDHFHRTSLIAEDPATDELAGFVIGFHSPSNADEAYIHFTGVSPEWRRTGLGRILYDRFFDAAREAGRSTVKAITSPSNEGSIAFHRSVGFAVEGPVADYDGPGVDRVVFTRPL